MLPLVSVVLPTHNRVQFLERAIRSVLRQTEQNFELIIVDDASTDDTPNYLARLATQDHRIRIIKNNQSNGAGGARNEGVEHRLRQWIAFLDDDDEWMPHKLQLQLNLLDADPNLVACSCNFILRFPSGRSRKVFLPQNVTLKQLLKDSVLGGASMCICSNKVLKEIGGFDSKFKSAQDWDLWVRLRQKGEIVACKEPLVLYQAHAGARITNNMQVQYVGARKFYFKHRNLMDLEVRRHRLASICYIMSRQTIRSLYCRIRYLIISLLNSSPRSAFSYAKSSLPRLIWDMFVLCIIQQKINR